MLQRLPTVRQIIASNVDEEMQNVLCDSAVSNTFCRVLTHISLAVTPNHHLQGAVGTDRALFRGMSWQGMAPLEGWPW